MTKMNWENARKTASPYDRIIKSGSFKVSEEFICFESSEPIEPALKNKLRALKSLLKFIYSLNFSNAPLKKKKHIGDARKLNEALSDSFNYFGSVTYRKAKLILEAYQHWPNRLVDKEDQPPSY